jgi:hypothetical protein
MTGDVKPQDKGSGLVERTLEGDHVEATYPDRHGHRRHAAGTVRCDDAGELVADGVRSQTPVTRDANVDVIGRKG